MKNKLLYAVLPCLLFAFNSKSQISNDSLLLESLHKSTAVKRDSLSKYYQLFFSKLNESKDPEAINKIQYSIDSLDLLFAANNREECLIDFEFVRNHLSSPISLNTLLYRIYRREGMEYYDSIEKLFFLLDNDLQKTEKGVVLKDALYNFKNSAVGSVAPDFKGKDINQHKLMLSAFRKHNYVLLDFWASWCAPCRQDFPALKEFYQKHHSRGLEIINVSRDEESILWKKAIEKDGIGSWLHFSIKENGSDIEKKYFVTAIPVKILINQEGVIIGRWRGGGEENMNELKKMLDEELP